ncbi:MAG: glycosyltransferase family 2 protein [Flavobacteriales bacterium]
MKLSVIIVNYNVEYFLEQCLSSVYKAMQRIETEVFVVDNNSVDGSVSMVKEKFTWVKLIENKENTGFSKANNQAIKISTGEYVLLLNPDTIVEEDTFDKVIEFMDTHQDAGGLGVKMIDGKGNFLPESKRGLPTPGVAFYKIFGLSALFSKSKIFGRYHLGFLDKDEIHEIEILSGAFMLIRKEALDKVGLLDETFFMYGEDIDLSYRIVKGGYKNYYFPKTRIIHYKGESTKKSSVNYVFVFYRAMIIFAQKHFSVKNAKLFSFCINLAIYFRAAIAVLNRFIKNAIPPILDFLAITGLLYAVVDLYQYLKNFYYDKDLVYLLLPVYGMIWLISVFYAGGYDRPIRIKNMLLGISAGTALILLLYALFPDDIRFSRMVIFLGFGVVLFHYLISRYVLHLAGFKKYALSASSNNRFAIIGKIDEFERVKLLLEQTSIKVEEAVSIAPSELLNKPLDQVVLVHKIDEVIFCARDVSVQQIISAMSDSYGKEVDFKIAQPDSLYLIGSNSIDTAGDLYMLDINSINKPKNRRNKRTLDVVLAVFLLLLSPILAWFTTSPFQFIRNIVSVLLGRKTWVGYAKNKSSENVKLPRIKPPVLPLEMMINRDKPNVLERINLIYARDYNIILDVKFILNNFRCLGSNYS